MAPFTPIHPPFTLLANRAQLVLESHLAQQEPPPQRQEINPDGNCFQAAVLVQIEQVDGQKKSVADLRAAVHKHLLAATRTPDEFEAFRRRLPSEVAASLFTEKNLKRAVVLYGSTKLPRAKLTHIVRHY